MGNKLWLVIPCYNEEEILIHSAKILEDKMKELRGEGWIEEGSQVLFVDDGSTDATWKLICELRKRSAMFCGIKLSHNEGHQNALLAGMMFAKDRCDCLITMDADLQDDVSVMEDFLDKYNQGYHIVYGVRNKRKKDSVLKRKTAQIFYKFMKTLGVEVIYNHADYRLLSKLALEALSEYHEANLFLRGIVPLIGLKSDCVYYERLERVAGKSKYSIRKMLGLAVQGITSFSVKPLRLISSLGILFSLFSIGGLMYALGSFLSGRTVPGWTAIISSIWLLGGIQMLCIGMLGEYLGRIYSEVKKRPRYFIEDTCMAEEERG